VRAQVLVHVTASDVDDSDQHLPITYKLKAADDSLAIDQNTSILNQTCFCFASLFGRTLIIHRWFFQHKNSQYGGSSFVQLLSFV